MGDHAARVAIVGAAGYTGAELVRLLLAHPRATLVHVAAKERAGQRISQSLPSLTGLCDLLLEPFDPDRIAKEANVVFCALPHGASASAVTALLGRGLRVLDLSADFRIRDGQVYETWYGPHPNTELLVDAVYGLPELHGDAIRRARLVAVPGCYPTSSILSLAPLLRAGLVHSEGIIVDAKSGVSGAGRSPTASTHLPETAEGMRAYKVAGAHRHTPEIEQELSGVCGKNVTVTFTPHLAPMSRGILATTYASVRTADCTTETCNEAARCMYRDSPSVRVLPAGTLPDTLFVRGSNFAHLAYAVDERCGRVVGMAAIDNLVKGAAGQAVQCMNLMLGLPEGEGLSGAPVFP